jgi:hypothetical protein
MVSYLSNRFLATVVVPDIRPEVLVGVQKLGQEPEHSHRPSIMSLRGDTLNNVSKKGS